VQLQTAEVALTFGISTSTHLQHGVGLLSDGLEIINASIDSDRGACRWRWGECRGRSNQDGEERELHGSIKKKLLGYDDIGIGGRLRPSLALSAAACLLVLSTSFSKLNMK
jgi:hypothetical protein